MKRAALAFFIAAYGISYAAYAESLRPEQSDEKAAEIIKHLPYPDYPLPADAPALWVKLAQNESPTLFLMPTELCGASDCKIIGFQNTSRGWKKIYEVFGGDSLEILNTKTQNHSDVVQHESQGGGDFIIKTSHWNLDHYDDPIITKPERQE